jgi:protein-tyrosine phosphatase
MSDPYRVTVVCWGNICRSPMAEHLLREALEDAGLADRVVVDSFGTSTDELGQAMDRRTANALRRNGSRDTGWAAHRARQIGTGDIAERDLVLAADHVHARILGQRAASDDDRGKIRLLRTFDPRAVESGTLGMDDPWYGDDADFDTTYAEVRAALPGLMAFIEEQVGDRAGERQERA